MSKSIISLAVPFGEGEPQGPRNGMLVTLTPDACTMDIVFDRARLYTLIGTHTPMNIMEAQMWSMAAVCTLPETSDVPPFRIEGRAARDLRGLCGFLGEKPSEELDPVPRGFVGHVTYTPYDDVVCLCLAYLDPASVLHFRILYSQAGVSACIRGMRVLFGTKSGFGIIAKIGKARLPASSVHEGAHVTGFVARHLLAALYAAVKKVRDAASETDPDAN